MCDTDEQLREKNGFERRHRVSKPKHSPFQSVLLLISQHRVCWKHLTFYPSFVNVCDAQPGGNSIPDQAFFLVFFNNRDSQLGGNSIPHNIFFFHFIALIPSWEATLNLQTLFPCLEKISRSFCELYVRERSFWIALSCRTDGINR